MIVMPVCYYYLLNRGVELAQGLF
uniref:Uncharacterized protein n=1 Tax=Anguilla anguilla TaxID=7936 RepID=A0A0E9X9Y2_ANGAN